MEQPQPGPQPDFAINPGHMAESIEWYLSPVITRLTAISKDFATAHGEVKAAHDQETPGWFAGVGNGDIRLVSSSFLNAAEWQLRQLVQDQDELVKSLEDYRTALLAHIEAAEKAERKVADRFIAIDRQLEEKGYDR